MWKGVQKFKNLLFCNGFRFTQQPMFCNVFRLRMSKKHLFCKGVSRSAVQKTCVLYWFLFWSAQGSRGTPGTGWKLPFSLFPPLGRASSAPQPLGLRFFFEDSWNILLNVLKDSYKIPGRSHEILVSLPLPPPSSSRQSLGTHTSESWILLRIFLQ